MSRAAPRAIWGIIQPWGRWGHPDETRKNDPGDGGDGRAAVGG